MQNSGTNERKGSRLCENARSGILRWGDVRGDEGEAFCRGPGPEPADPAAGILDDYVGENNPVRVVDAFVAELDLAALGFTGVVPEATGRPSYHPLTLLKIYLYGYLNRIASSRRLEREAQRNMELMWLTGRLIPDFKTIADFRKDNGAAIRRSAATLCCSAASSICSPTLWSRSMVASSRR